MARPAVSAQITECGMAQAAMLSSRRCCLRLSALFVLVPEFEEAHCASPQGRCVHRRALLLLVPPLALRPALPRVRVRGGPR
ncbi:hypothetical protein OsI_02314 [Oryza sativa Indica Group]|uniref:Uncharacterized protein n=1 Tax=Oryza sativa subsp. indica TaxID=39946 RepID=B8A9P7_ORYSI|nr:hypothetical protein OsI_02314 [Oryza sativa Indica Group]